jgi:hypothetical protein
VLNLLIYRGMEKIDIEAFKQAGFSYEEIESVKR